MPFLIPRTVSSNQVAFVLAFGGLSNLELCSLFGREITSLETPCERVSVITAKTPPLQLVRALSGVHKAAPLLDTVSDDHATPESLAQVIAENFDTVPTLSASGYDINEDDYEILVRSLLDQFRSKGFRKTRLLRPKGNELKAEEVMSRRALDVVMFPYHKGYALGTTAWVPDSTSMRERGTRKPMPRPEVSMSPRLASLLVNLAGLRKGETLLDPFCGSGTILAEALLRGYRCLGIDSDANRVRDSRQNLRWTASDLRSASYDITVGDARDLHELLGGERVSAVVTEPLLIPSLAARPKLETANQLLEEAGSVYADALGSIAEALSPGRRIVIVVPVIKTIEGKEVSIVLDGRPLGLKQYQPGPTTFHYPVRPSFESTRWLGRAVYVFESAS